MYSLIKVKQKRHHKSSIALMCTSLNMMAGGLERQIVLTAESLSKEYNVYLVSFDSLGDISFYTIPSSVVWLKCGGNLPPHKSARPSQRINQLLFLRNILKKHNIICLITFHHGLYLRSLVATMFTNIVNIVSERNSLAFYDYIKMRRNNLALLLSHTARFRTVQLKAYIREYPIAFQKRIRVIPNFLPNVENFKEPNITGYYVLMVGRLEAQKNFQLLLTQMLEYNKKLPFKVGIAGDGNLRSEIITKYKSLLSCGSLEMLGNVSDILTTMQQSSLLCFPSLWEGYPNAMLEALACGLPIVTTQRLSMLSEFIEHDVNGLIVKDSDLLTSILDIIHNKERMQRFSHASRRKFQDLGQANPGHDWSSLIREAL